MLRSHAKKIPHIVKKTHLPLERTFIAAFRQDVAHQALQQSITVDTDLTG
jgi:hypothetical protein